MSEVAMMSLIATGMPESGPGRRAVSTGRYSKAFRAGSRAFVFCRRPAAYSSAVRGFFPNRRRSSRTPASDLHTERAVGSVMPASLGTDEPKTISDKVAWTRGTQPVSSRARCQDQRHFGDAAQIYLHTDEVRPLRDRCSVKAAPCAKGSLPERCNLPSAQTAASGSE